MRNSATANCRVRRDPQRREHSEKAGVPHHICIYLLGRSFTQGVEMEPAAVLELGGAAGRSLTEGQSNFGPTVAVEVTPIEDRLELEAGVTSLFRRHSPEWSIETFCCLRTGQRVLSIAPFFSLTRVRSDTSDRYLARDQDRVFRAAPSRRPRNKEGYIVQWSLPSPFTPRLNSRTS